MKCKLCTNLFNKYTQQGGYENNIWYCNLCIHDQPERLNPKDTWIKNVIVDELFDDNGNLKSICDSPTTENK